ncbi:UNKNOWN [Stylonychia lemnae]|uniref:Uncharacterized protein n=1 Tax=Stylonychia lemnae TaxID=5949 RepID=A0A078BB34_STYLE|nr:UNKNOWN [Stylonychia lemnae]|eukprot:CDW90457.1 UNKNOWN [Stylonychia lemnae]
MGQSASKSVQSQYMRMGRQAEPGPECKKLNYLLADGTIFPGIEDKLEFLNQKYEADDEFKQFIDELNLECQFNQLSNLRRESKNLSEEKCEQIKIRLEELFEFKSQYPWEEEI